MLEKTQLDFVTDNLRLEIIEKNVKYIGMDDQLLPAYWQRQVYWLDLTRRGPSFSVTLPW